MATPECGTRQSAKRHERPQRSRFRSPGLECGTNRSFILIRPENQGAKLRNSGSSCLAGLKRFRLGSYSMFRVPSGFT